MIRGKKNFLPPHPLIMGFGLLIRLDESSLGSHLNERRVRGEEEGTQDFEEEGTQHFEEDESPKGNSDSESEKEETDEKCVPESKILKDPSTHQPILEGISESGSTHDELTTSNAGSVNFPEVPLERRNMLYGNDSGHIADISGGQVPAVNPTLEDLIDMALELGSNTSSGKKYALETSQIDLEEDNHEDRKGSVREKPYISKAERRKLKKGEKTSTSDANGDHVKEVGENNASTSQHVKDVKNSHPAVGKISRGQKGKHKKMKEKYADQDEEERSIRMALLAVSTCTYCISLQFCVYYCYPNLKHEMINACLLLL